MPDAVETMSYGMPVFKLGGDALPEPLVEEIVRARLADLRAGTAAAASLDPDEERD